MKAAIVKFMFVSGITAGMIGCAEDAAVNTTDDPLQLSFKLSETQDQSALPAETSLMISMESASGEPIYSLENIPFSKSGNGFTTAGLDVNPGEYVLTEFMLVDAEGKIMYTIPYSDSPLKGAVTSPLGINVTVTPNAPGKVTTEVLNVSRHKPSDFGLASFRTSNSFQIVVSENESGKSVSANAVILDQQDTVASMVLPAKKSRISFDGSPDKTYTLVVSKAACAPYVAEFTLGEWAKTYRNKAMKVSLAPAFTMTAEADANPEYPFYFYIGGEQANLSINWGDGETETLTINEVQGQEITHDYAAAGSYPITITGDLDKIVHFYSFYGGSVFSDIQFQHLTNLEELLYGLTASPATIDLSQNTNLETAMLPGLRDLETLILPETNSLTFLEVDGDNRLNTDDVDAIINNIYTNASSANRREGVLGLRASWAQAEDDMTMIGPPSAESLILLESLRDEYGWIVHPSESTDKMKSDGRIAARRRI
jgi:hypothetical protein